MTYQETIELKDKILKCEISVADATELYFAKTKTKSWHTKDWKERRVKVIKDECEICTSKEVLTLQHKSHPRKLSDIVREITTNLARDYVETNPAISQDEFLSHVKNNFTYCPVKLCPNCNSRNPNERMRKTPQYLCTVCRLEFDEAIHKSVEDLIAEFYSNADTPEVNDKCFVSKDKYGNVQRLSQIKYWLLREGAKGKNKDEIERTAFLRYLDENIKYLSFEDTMTCCKKCAFSYDLNNMELCPQCKKYYKGISYPTCIECLPEDRKKAAKEKIEFGKAWASMHEELGID